MIFKLWKTIRKHIEMRSVEYWMQKQIDTRDEKIKELEALLRGADGCCCRFDDDDNQVRWCMVHSDIRDRANLGEERLDWVIKNRHKFMDMMSDRAQTEYYGMEVDEPITLIDKAMEKEKCL